MHYPLKVLKFLTFSYYFFGAINIYLYLCNNKKKKFNNLNGTTMKQLKVNITDGGRSKYFKADSVGDCVTRAIAIVTGRDYKEVYNEITNIVGYTPRNGVKHKDTKKVMKHFGGNWNACMGIGTGCRIHLADEWSYEGYEGLHNLPMHSKIICNLSGHVCAVIDGVIHDTHDPSRNGTRCVYGFWSFKK